MDRLQVYSTCPKIAEQQRWVEFSDDKQVHEGRIYAFCDGSTRGWHGAIVVRPGIDITRYRRFREPDDSRNVGAEWAGLHLALSKVPEGSEVTVVFDMIGLGNWMCGNWACNSPVVQKAARSCWYLIDQRQLDPIWVQTRGHQKDPSHFTYFNNDVDYLCQEDVADGYLGPLAWGFVELPS